jgi:alpha-glucosidase
MLSADLLQFTSQAAIAAMLLLTLPGTLNIYYGGEIGMTNGLIRPEEVQDPTEKRQSGIGMGRDQNELL